MTNLLINNTRALNAYSYKPMTKASSEKERLALAVPGDILNELMERLIDEVSLIVGEGDMVEERRVDKREEAVLLGGLKMSLASSS